jgi:uncharacterized phiE125 gp8 family phage protein
MLTLVTPAAATPVTLTEARAHCRADSADDTMLQIYLDAAVAHVDGAEGVLGRCLVTQTWDYSLDCFPEEITVPLPTLQSVTSVKYYDVDGVEQTITSSNYIVAGQRIAPIETFDWPDIDTERPYPITVRFVAGYGDAAEVPAAIKAAILLLTGDLYANREAGGEAVVENPATKRLLGPFKKVRV